jgi:hypothetical protein
MSWAFSAIAAISFMHGQDIIHRDIKPANFFLDENHEIVLADLGISRMLRPDESLNESTNVWTVDYASPEVLDGRSLGPESDIWSYAFVLFQIATVTTPSVHGSTGTAKLRSYQSGQRPKPRDAKHWRESNPLRQLATRCWELAPSARPTADAIVREFQAGKHRPRAPDWLGTSSDAWDDASEAKFVAHMDRVMRAIQRSEARLRDTEPEHHYLTHDIASNLFGEMSWRAAQEALNKASSDSDARLLCAVLFHRGIVFDRDDAIAIALLQHRMADGTQEAARMLRDIEKERTDYVMGCKEEFNGNLRAAYRHYMEGIKKSSCPHCLAQLGVMLLRNGSDRAKAEGVRLLEIGCGAGSIRCLFVLGEHEVTVNAKETPEYAKGHKRLEKAAAQGHLGAQDRLRQGG